MSVAVHVAVLCRHVSLCSDVQHVSLCSDVQHVTLCSDVTICSCPNLEQKIFMFELLSCTGVNQHLTTDEP